MKITTKFIIISLNLYLRHKEYAVFIINFIRSKHFSTKETQRSD